MRARVLAAALILISSTVVGAQVRYPIVFDSVSKLKEFGVALDDLVSERTQEAFKALHFANRCYYYGDGGHGLSVSDALLEFYFAKGFSRRSLCLALISGIRFNPETGRRLATLVLVDRKALAKAKRENRNPEWGEASEELPLSVPDCFKQALPYSNCRWSYDPLSGRKFSAQKVKNYAGLGSQIEALLGSHGRGADDDCASGKTVSAEGEEELMEGTLRLCEFELGNELDQIRTQTDITLIDYSKDFPKGFGYALYAFGAAGPAVSANAIKAALESRAAPPQIDVEKLKQIWETNSH
jgi:hypothetical protein